MPIFVALIGLKAMKALILSKLAITIVLGFLISQLVKKTGLGMMPMSMMPTDAMMMNTTPATPDTSYGPAAWESANSAYSVRNSWDASPASSSHNLAYSAYYPGSSSSSYSSPSSSSSSSSSANSVSGSSSQTATAQAY